MQNAVPSFLETLSTTTFQQLPMQGKYEVSLQARMTRDLQLHGKLMHYGFRKNWFIADYGYQSKLAVKRLDPVLSPAVIGRIADRHRLLTIGLYLEPAASSCWAKS